MEGKDTSGSPAATGAEQVLLSPVTSDSSDKEVGSNGHTDTTVTEATKAAGEQTPLIDVGKSPVIVAAKQVEEPVDRNKFVYLVFVLHGIGVLMSWNMFITAKPYFEEYKFGVKNSTEDGHASSETDYRPYFIPFVGIASQVPNVVCNVINLFVSSG